MREVFPNLIGAVPGFDAIDRLDRCLSGAG